MGTLEIDEHGQGSAVVLLHGAPSAPNDFAPLVDALCNSHRVLVPHLPGYGRTPALDAPYSFARVQDLLCRSLAERGIRELALLGFSNGAYHALSLALNGPFVTSRLMLLAPYAGLDPEVAQSYRGLAQAARDGALDMSSVWLSRMASPRFAERDPQGAARLMGWLSAAPAPVLCDELEAMAGGEDLRPRLAELDMPVKVLCGALDQAVPPAWGQAIASTVQHGELELLEGVGHASFIEAPRLVARRVRAFFV